MSVLSVLLLLLQYVVFWVTSKSALLLKFYDWCFFGFLVFWDAVFCCCVCYF